MNIHPHFGPQFDAQDGTIGTLPLVRRWVLATQDNQIWGCRQGRCTFPSKTAAEQMVKQIRQANNASRFPEDLHAGEWWCYPDHYDPVWPAPPQPEQMRVPGGVEEG